MPDNAGRMERIRADLLRRARTETTDNQAQHLAPPTTQAPLQRSRGDLSPRLQHYARRLTNALPHRERAHRTNGRNDESPKSPTTESGWPTVTRAQPRPVRPPLRMAVIDHTLNIPTVNVTLPERPGRAITRTRERISDPTSGQPTNTTNPQQTDDGASERPKRFMYCFPWPKSRRVRTLALQSIVSGIFLFTILAVYLGLTVSRTITISELTVLLLIVVIFATVYFCYSFIRFCILVARGDTSNRASGLHPLYLGGYAVPRSPIRVVLARDEEEGGARSEAAKVVPPAYGLWRESVRLDPNRLYWQRNEPAELEAVTEDRPVGPRPPSYASDDGVAYAVEARPRSMAPPAMEQVPQMSQMSQMSQVSQVSHAR